MPNSLENQFIADTFKALLHTGNVSLSSGSPDAKLYSGDGFESSLTVSTVSNGIKVSGNATISGDVLANGGIFSGSLTSGSHTLIGNSNISGSIDVDGGASIGGLLNSGSHVVLGSSNITGSLNSGSHTVTGDSNISGTVNIGNNAKVVGFLNSGSHTVVGNSDISGNININRDAKVLGYLTSGSHTVLGDSKISNRLDTDVIYANTYLNLPETDTRAAIVNHIYPVGSIFLSLTLENPSFRFTGTTWIQVSQGRFVVGVGTGNDGVQNRAFAAGNTNGEYRHQLTIAEMPSHRHSIEVAPSTDADDGGGGDYNGRNGTSYTSYEGDDQYHENTPPGFGLYVWQRTS